MNGLDRISHGFGQLRYFQAGIRGITTTVIKEVANIVCLEDLDEPFVFAAILLEALQLAIKLAPTA